VFVIATHTPAPLDRSAAKFEGVAKPGGDRVSATCQSESGKISLRQGMPARAEDAPRNEESQGERNATTKRIACRILLMLIRTRRVETVRPKLDARVTSHITFSNCHRMVSLGRILRSVEAGEGVVSTCTEFLTLLKETDRWPTILSSSFSEGESP
jgi:hypothetical protein